jgi:glycosyltransferase involved in cell wall biosynthesis
MRIGFVTQWFDPEEGSAAVPGGMVRALEQLGHQVEVVTGFPNYPYGRLYDGYHMRPYMVERRGSTTVHRVPLYPSHDRSAARRAANYASFAMSAATLGVARVRKANVILVYSTPATVGLAGLAARRLWHQPFVLYIQDLWPDTLMAAGMLPEGRLTRLLEARLGRFCQGIYRRASRIAVISPGMSELLTRRGVPDDKIDVIHNWVDEDVFRPVRQALGQRDDGFEVMYAGSMGDVQGLDVAVEAIALLSDLPDVRLRLVGSGVAVPRLKELATRLAVSDRVVFEGSRPLREMASVMVGADVQLVCLRDLPLFQATMPSKMQAILATGCPVVVSAPGDAAGLAVRSGAGVACPPGSATGLAAALRQMRSLPAHERVRMGRAGREYYERELSSAIGSRRLESALAAAVLGSNATVSA